MAPVVVERSEEVAIVRLNRPQSLNAINEDIRRVRPPALAESGEPQKLMREFLAKRNARKKA